MNICLIILPSIIAFLVVRRLRKQAKERDFETEVSKLKMERLAMINDNDIFEMLCSVMEGQRDIMDLVYRTATKDETYKGRSLTMKEIHERQEHLTETKKKILMVE